MPHSSPLSVNSMPMWWRKMSATTAMLMDMSSTMRKPSAALVRTAPQSARPTKWLTRMDMAEAMPESTR